MTYRERREARAERLRGWADKREARRIFAEQISDLFELEPWQRRLLADIESGRQISFEASSARERRDSKRMIFERVNALYRALGYTVEEHGHYAVFCPPEEGSHP